MQKKMYFLISDCNFLYKKSTKPLLGAFMEKMFMVYWKRARLSSISACCSIRLTAW